MTRFAFMILAAVGAALANAAAAEGLKPADREAVARAEAYLNEMHSLQSRFVQSSSNGEFAQGRLYLQRPKRLRLDYDAPSALQVYADGYWLIYVDTELEEVTHVPLDRTPAGFLVRKTVSLSDGVRVTKVERTDHRLFIHVVQADEPESGTVILSFDPDPLRLREWTVVDAQGIRTLVALIAPTFNAPIERKVFDFDQEKFSGDRPGG